VASHECTTACWLIVPPAFERSNFSLLGAPAPTDAFLTPAAEVGTTMSGNRPINFAEMPNSTVHLGIFYMPQICDMGLTALLPFRRKACLRIFPTLKIRRLRPGLNPRTWVPEASTLTPRPPKPLCKELVKTVSIRAVKKRSGLLYTIRYCCIHRGIQRVTARWLISETAAICDNHNIASLSLFDHTSLR
jgi:hypothetical protein